jgi:hypothetical protein
VLAAEGSPGGPAADADAPLLLGSAAVRARAADPYRAAGQRLQSLLAGVGGGEEELLSSMLREESADKKILVALTAAGILSGGAGLACWLCGLDPLGGASLSLASLRAAALGAAAAIPLVAAKAALWSDAARAELPFLEEVQARTVEEFQPLLHELNAAQCAVILGSEVVPGLVILLPAVTGGIEKTLQGYAALAGIPAPSFLPAAAALAVAALLAALAKLTEHGVTSEEFDCVRDALDNAERYYKVMAQGNDCGGGEPAAAEAAFRAVAVTWVARRTIAARFAACASALEVLYLGALWQHTGDLAAPLAAALASAAVDFGFIRSGMPRQEQGPSAP